MTALKDIDFIYTINGRIRFINPDQFYSVIKINVVHDYTRRYSDEFETVHLKMPRSFATYYQDKPMLIDTYKKRFRTHFTRTTPQWHSFNRLLEKAWKIVNVSHPEEGMEDESIKMMEDFQNPDYAIRISDSSFIMIDSSKFTYFVTSDGTRGELVYLGKTLIKVIKIDKDFSVQQY